MSCIISCIRIILCIISCDISYIISCAISYIISRAISYIISCAISCIISCSILYHYTVLYPISYHVLSYIIILYYILYSTVVYPATTISLQSPYYNIITSDYTHYYSIYNATLTQIAAYTFTLLSDFHFHLHTCQVKFIVLSAIAET